MHQSPSMISNDVSIWVYCLLIPIHQTQLKMPSYCLLRYLCYHWKSCSCLWIFHSIGYRATVKVEHWPSNVWDEITYLFPNFNGCTWSLGMDKKFHPALHNRCNYLSMLGLKLTHVSKSRKTGGKRLFQYHIRLLIVRCRWSKYCKTSNITRTKF